MININNIVLNSFIVSAFAGLSTLFGTIIIFLRIKNTNNVIAYSLSFAAGVMITVSIIDLIPSSIKEFSKYYYSLFLFLYIFVFVLMGVIISMLIDINIPNSNNYNSSLYKTGVFTMIVLLLHNIPEGITTFMTSSYNFKMGLGLAIAISLHNIPEGISISIPIYCATKKKFKAFINTLISGLGELLGAVITYLFLYKYINGFFMACLFSVVAGIMIYVSIYNLIPMALQYNRSYKVYILLVLGSIFMCLSHFVLY